MFDPVAEARVLLKDLAAEDRSGWTPQARSDRVRDLAELHERTAAELLRTVEVWDTGSDWALDGQLSAPAWLAWQTPATKTDAAKLIRTARFVRRYNPIAEALTGGDVAVAHVEAMARAERHHEDEFALSADALLTAAKEMGPTEFADVCRTWAQLVDDRKPAHDFDDRAFRIRYLMDGWGVPDGLLDPETCALLEACFKDLAPPDPAGGPEPVRTAGQRHADAVTDLARRHLRGHDGAAPSSTADVVVDADTYATHRYGECLLPADRLPQDPAWATANVVARGPIGLSDLERLFCDSPVGRLVLNARGEVLDVGRQERQYNRAQRRAMARRDGGCPFPGCDRPPEWCDAHHLTYWKDGGRTDLAEGCLICRRHHVLIHAGGWKLERNPDTGIFTATSPTGQTYQNDPRTRRRRASPGNPQPPDRPR